MELKTLSFNDFMEIVRKASALRFSLTPPSKKTKKSVVIHSLYDFDSGDGFYFDLYGFDSGDGFYFDFCDDEYVFCREGNHQIEMVNDCFLVKSFGGRTEFYITPLFSRTLEEILKEIEEDGERKS